RAGSADTGQEDRNEAHGEETNQAAGRDFSEAGGPLQAARSAGRRGRRLAGQEGSTPRDRGRKARTSRYPASSSQIRDKPPGGAPAIRTAKAGRDRACLSCPPLREREPPV